ncbi:ankyrin-1-like [Branchiostoma lanceolatum]|uniref:ankyrin-1-like n=1 Tax=Branchiostoma lanceolatum TaxID=7740 RepID=UPI00345600C0
MKKMMMMMMSRCENSEILGGANVNAKFYLIENLQSPLNDELSSLKTVTPLILGVVDRKLEIVKKLVQDCGADVNVTNEAGKAPLHCIATNTVDKRSASKTQVKQKIAEILLKAGAEVNIQDKKGQTPLHCAAMAKDLASAQILLENGARVDIGKDDGDTPLHIAVREVDTQLCHHLIQQESGKTAVNQKAHDGATPLHLAIEASVRRCARQDRMAVVQLLIDNGADLTSQKHGLTPLHLAAEAGFIDVVKMLVEAGADIHAEALKTGLTPLDMAIHTNKQDIVDYLVARAESDTAQGGRPKRDSPSKEEEEDSAASQQTDTPVEVMLEEEGAVGGFEQVLVIKDEGCTEKE